MTFADRKDFTAYARNSVTFCSSVFGSVDCKHLGNFIANTLPVYMRCFFHCFSVREQTPGVSHSLCNQGALGLMRICVSWRCLGVLCLWCMLVIRSDFALFCCWESLVADETSQVPVASHTRGLIKIKISYCFCSDCPPEYLVLYSDVQKLW